MYLTRSDWFLLVYNLIYLPSAVVRAAMSYWRDDGAIPSKKAADDIKLAIEKPSGAALTTELSYLYL